VTTHSRVSACVLTGLGLAVWIGWPTAPGVIVADEQRKNFVACPVVRDTASVPCWLADYEGETYFLTLQTDVSAPVTPPWLGHRVLVEGTVSSEPRICGGVVLKPVRLSVLNARDASCNTMLPAEERYNLTFEPPRPPGPSRGRLAFDYPAAPTPAAAEVPAVKEFRIAYDFDRLVGFSHAGSLTEILQFARTSNARTIEIVGHRGAVLLSNGETMTEGATIGKQRAEEVAMLLQGAGLKTPTYTLRWLDEPAKPTGVDDYLSRQVRITVRR
jgi:hypothetical protein